MAFTVDTTGLGRAGRPSGFQPGGVVDPDLYRGDRPIPEVRDRTAILVDDGIATGRTARLSIVPVFAPEIGRAHV